MKRLTHLLALLCCIGCEQPSDDHPLATWRPAAEAVELPRCNSPGVCPCVLNGCDCHCSGCACKLKSVAVTYGKDGAPSMKYEHFLDAEHGMQIVSDSSANTPCEAKK